MSAKPDVLSAVRPFGNGSLCKRHDIRPITLQSPPSIISDIVEFLDRAVFHDESDLQQGVDVSQRIPANRNDICQLSWLDASDVIAEANVVGCMYCGRFDGVYRAHSRLDHRAKFARILPMRGYTGIGIKGDAKPSFIIFRKSR